MAWRHLDLVALVVGATVGAALYDFAHLFWGVEKNWVLAVCAASLVGFFARYVVARVCGVNVARNPG